MADSANTDPIIKIDVSRMFNGKLYAVTYMIDYAAWTGANDAAKATMAKHNVDLALAALQNGLTRDAKAAAVASAGTAPKPPSVPSTSGTAGGKK